MTPPPRTEAALHNTANDFRALGSAVKQDFANLREEARARIDNCTHKAVEDANQNLDRLRGFTVENPLRALAYAALGGIAMGLYLRR